MSVWQQIVFFAFKGLKPSYYWRHFILGGILPIIFIGYGIYSLFHNPNVTLYDVVTTSFLLLTMLVLYPFSRFAYESIVEFVMGNNVIIANAMLIFIYKYLSYALLLTLSWFIAPIGMIILFFYNKHQYKIAQEQSVQNTQDNQ